MPLLFAADIRADARYRFACYLFNHLWQQNFIAPDRRREFLKFGTDTLRKLRAARPAWMNHWEDSDDAQD